VDLGYQSSVAGVAREGPYMLEKTVDGLAGQGFRQSFARLLADGDDDLVLAAEVAVDGSVGQAGLGDDADEATSPRHCSS
jgi:hypothetical protein